MILLDTHAFYWYMCDKDRLTPAIVNRIEAEDCVCVSIATFWEMTIKSSLGKLILPAPISSLMEACDALSFTLLPITADHLTCLAALPFFHRDPFDRLIIAQAIAENMTIITTDHTIPQYPVKTLWE